MIDGGVADGRGFVVSGSGEAGSARPVAGEGKGVSSDGAEMGSTGSRGGSDLREMVWHRLSVRAEETLEDVYVAMGHHAEEFVAVVEGARYLGVVSRTGIMSLLSGRYGFPLYARRAVREQMIEGALSVAESATLSDLLDAAFAREGVAFHSDVALVSDAGEYLGMIPMRSLVRLQSGILTERTEVVRAQHAALESRNRELFRSVAELRQSRGRYDILFENSAMGVALMNARAEIGSCNRRFCEIVGWPPEASVEPRGAVLLPSLPPASRERFGVALRDLEDGRSARIELEMEVDVTPARRTTCRAYLGWVRETAQVSVLLEDVTEQRQMERLVAQREKSALLDTLVGGVAHELNNKLTPIFGYASALEQKARRPGVDPEIARGLEIVRRSAGDAAHIIRQLLQLSRPAVLGDCVSCDLCGVVREVVEVLRYQIREANCATRLDLPPEGLVVSADAGQMKQVLLNLMVNALHALRGRAVRELAVRVERRGGVAHCVLRDTGCGMGKDVLARVFDPFFSTKGPSEGTGLGLSVCESIIRAHGGNIRLESEPGSGTVALIDLPVSDVAPSEEEPGATSVTGWGGEMLTVLVADDEEFVVNLVQEVLRTYIRCRVKSAPDGLQALRVVEEGRVDLIISDVRMPNMDGLEFFSRLSARWPQMAERFLFMTGDPGGRALDERLEATGVPVLMKPFKIDNLIARCRQLLVGEKRER